MERQADMERLLRGHRNIVTYIDSHASQLSTGYEVLVLMEHCSGGALIDLMNSRLHHRLAECEILLILSDVAKAVKCMHSLSPPLIHRDLKVENVLITDSKICKLCDFGSAAPPVVVPVSPEDYHRLRLDIETHTTAQYRSPEMTNLALGLPINEKSDIWALGVLLYKLCYYTTPLEANYTFPLLPSYSPAIRTLIDSMLREDPHQRPHISTLVDVLHSLTVVEPQKLFSSVSKDPKNLGDLEYFRDLKYQRDVGDSKDLRDFKDVKDPRDSPRTILSGKLAGQFKLFEFGIEPSQSPSYSPSQSPPHSPSHSPSHSRPSSQNSSKHSLNPPDLSQFDSDTRERLETYTRRAKEASINKIAPIVLQNTVHRLLQSQTPPPKPHKPARLLDSIKSSAHPDLDFERAFDERFPTVDS